MRIVITGFGLTTAAGDTAEQSWEAFCSARSGIGENTIVPRKGVMSDRAGQVRSLREDGKSRKDRSVRLGEVAIHEALEHAGLRHRRPFSDDRIGLSLGTSLGGARSGEKFHQDWIDHGLTGTNRFDLIQYPLHATGDALARTFALHGPRTVHSNACAAGAVAIINGVEYLRDGLADAVVAGGVDPLAWLSFGGFSSLGVLSLKNCAPYTRSDGITLGEGAGFLILEPLEQASDRGATIHAEVLGYGLSADAYHPTAPDPRGRGAVKAMDYAFRMAGLDRDAVDYVNGHGTGTPANDEGEMKVIRTLGDGRIPISSTKSMTGHTLGAAGAVEAVVSVMALEKDRVPPTFIPDDDAAQAALNDILSAGEIDIVPNQARDRRVDVVVSNSFAFGGNNASLIIGSLTGRNEVRKASEDGGDRNCRIVGTAAVAGQATSADEILDAFTTASPLARDRVDTTSGEGTMIGRCDPKRLAHGINPRALRRLDPLSKLAVQVVSQLIRNHKLTASQLADTGLVFATSTGPLSTVEEFQRGLMVEGQGDSKLFPNTVMNAAAGHVAMMFGLRGPTATICAGGASGVSALHLGQQLIRNGSCDRAIVVAAEEVNDILVAGYGGFPGYLATDALRPNQDSGIAYCESGVALLLERGGTQDQDSAVDAPILAGMGLTGDGPGAGRIAWDESAWQRSFELAIKQAGIGVSELDLVISAACGHEPIDRIERAALAGLGLRSDTTIVHPKAITGEMQSASPLFGIILGGWLTSGKHMRLDGDDVSLAAAGGPRNVLVSGYGIGGSFQSFVVRY
ncbi:MAG: beta-ketoacyl synthase N-terminal-like domain-containing protein [Arachnia sp.]